MIRTPRLVITPLGASDAEEFFELTGDDTFNAFPINVYRQTSLATTRDWIRTSRGKFAVRAAEALIGMGGLTPWQWEGEDLVDITYRLRGSAVGQGYGWELAVALRDHAFQTLALPHITATITPDNAPSKRIAVKLGFRFEKNILLNDVPTELHRLIRP
jgi:[ribosomal protein S5]-alanine N-acetyltransferase